MPPFQAIPSPVQRAESPSATPQKNYKQTPVINNNLKKICVICLTQIFFVL